MMGAAKASVRVFAGLAVAWPAVERRRQEASDVRSIILLRA